MSCASSHCVWHRACRVKLHPGSLQWDTLVLLRREQLLQLHNDPVVVATFVTGNVGRRDGAIGALSVVNAVEDGDLCCDVGDDVFSDIIALFHQFVDNCDGASVARWTAVIGDKQRCSRRWMKASRTNVTMIWSCGSYQRDMDKNGDLGGEVVSEAQKNVLQCT